MSSLATTAAPLTAARLADLAYDRIREMILDGRIEMGERLVEAQIARDFGISRAPVREAVRRLVEDGLAEERPRIGATVCELSGNDVADIYNVRLPLEASAISIATHNGMDVAPLETMIGRMKTAAKKKDRTAVTKAELNFHAEIFRATQNGMMLQVFRMLEARILLAMLLDNGEFSSLEDVAEEHWPLVEAIRSGDARTASNLMVAHIISTVRPLLERLGGDPDRLRVPEMM